MIYPGDTVKSLILQSLAEKKSLLAKEIHGELLGGECPDVSFQWIYKTLSSLVDDGVLVHSQNRYSISPLFKKTITKFVAQMHYHDPHILEIALREGESTERVFGDQLSTYHYLRFVHMETSLDHFSSGPPLFAFHRHCGSFYLPQSIEAMKHLVELGYGFRFYVTGQEVLDFRMKDLFRIRGIDFVFVEQETLRVPETEYVVISPYVITVSFPPGYMKRYDELLRKLDPEDVDTRELSKFLSSRSKTGKFRVRIEHHKTYAEELIREMEAMKRRGVNDE